MAKSSSNVSLTQRKQKSIASFFTPSAVKTSDVVSIDTPQKSVASNADTTILKHPLTIDDDTQNDYPTKRLKSDESHADDVRASKEWIRDVDNNDKISISKTARISERTSKYLFSTCLGMADTLEVIDEDERRNRQRIHENFVKKLGGPDSLAKLKRRFQDEEDAVDEDLSSTDEARGRDESSTKVQGRARKQPASRKDKYTPLERQVIDIKRKNPDTLLIIEVGYKFRFFGEDARIAAKELSIVCIPGKFRFDEHPSEAHLNRFASASVPVHRLHVHVKRLVSAGHKVGVVRQLETAALKAAGANRNSAFERGLTNLYTKGTYIDDQEGLDSTEADDNATAPATGHLFCLTETFPKGWGTDEKVHIGFVAVQPATGDIIYDDFEDGWMRSELETRLLHIAPCEFLIVGEITKATDRLIRHLTASRSNVFNEKARIEFVDKPKTMAAQAHSHLIKFYAEKMKTESTSESGTLLDKVHKLSENATICLSAMIKHLAGYKLEHVFDLTRYFQSFSARSHMLINGNTLNSLEIFRNQTDLTVRGSLFWALDRTQTRFGQRLLRKWVARPLLDRLKLDERVAAVTELKEKQHSTAVNKLNSLLGRVRGDLERSLIRIYYKKCTRSELLKVLQTLQLIAQEYAHVSTVEDTTFDSSLISQSITLLPKIMPDVLQYLERINAEAGSADDKYDFFREDHETEAITNHKVGIVAVEHDLKEFKTVVSSTLKQRFDDYVTVAGIDYLIELDNTSLRNVPASWIKISGTKKVSRYHAPEVIKLIRERDQHMEALANACDEAFSQMLGEIGNDYQMFRDCVQSLAQLDCLLSLAEVASQPGYCKPIYSDQPGINIKAGRHPMVEQILLSAFVPNDVDLSSNMTRALLVTGPNMGGKSSYVRSVALICIMAQCGSYVPADSAELGLLDAVFTRMGAFDNMMKRESTFMVELSETSDILKQATSRSLVILDELGRGTSTHDGVAIAEAVLHYMVTQLKSFTLFITHYQSLTHLAKHFNGELKNIHMRFAGDPNENHDITFLYEVGEGVAHRSYGMNVAKMAGLPEDLIVNAAEHSRVMEERERRSRVGHLAKIASQYCTGHESLLKHLTAAIEQL